MKCVAETECPLHFLLESVDGASQTPPLYYKLLKHNLKAARHTDGGVRGWDMLGSRCSRVYCFVDSEKQKAALNAHGCTFCGFLLVCRDYIGPESGPLEPSEDAVRLCLIPVPSLPCVRLFSVGCPTWGNFLLRPY